VARLRGGIPSTRSGERAYFLSHVGAVARLRGAVRSTRSGERAYFLSLPVGAVARLRGAVPPTRSGERAYFLDPLSAREEYGTYRSPRDVPLRAGGDEGAELAGGGEGGLGSGLWVFEDFAFVVAD
jgi:hypothetical protein